MPPISRYSVTITLEGDDADRFAAWCYLNRTPRAQVMKTIVGRFLEAEGGDVLVERALRIRRRHQIGLEVVGS